MAKKEDEDETTPRSIEVTYIDDAYFMCIDEVVTKLGKLGVDLSTAKIIYERDSYDSVAISVIGQRLETAEEVTKRLQLANKYAEEGEQRDRREYERLKMKFESEK